MRTALILLLVLLLVLPAFHLGCTSGIDRAMEREGRTARSPPLVDGASLTIKTRATGLFGMGRLERQVMAERMGKPIAEGWLGDTRAAVWAINVYQAGPRELVLAHRLQAFDVILAEKVVRPQPPWPCGKDRPAGATYLGVVDGAKGHKLPFRFIPAAEREERPML